MFIIKHIDDDDDDDDDDCKTIIPITNFVYKHKTTMRDKITTFKRFNHSITQYSPRHLGLATNFNERDCVRVLRKNKKGSQMIQFGYNVERKKC